MKKHLISAFVILAILFNSCTNGQVQEMKTELSATEFAAKINELETVQILDVRTPEEFSEGHLENAKNMDWNGSAFDQQITTLDKSQPVLVYCLSGRRSAEAASRMRSEGFKEVYELNGGILKWRGANLPETTGKTTDNTTTSTGITRQQFDELLHSDKLVLVDFYADWCGPCKKMKPYLDEISKDMAEKVVVIRINADDNKGLYKELKIDNIPVLHLYKNKTLLWTYEGFIDKVAVVNQINTADSGK